MDSRTQYYAAQIDQQLTKSVTSVAMPPIRAQLSLIADNLLAALEQITRIEDSILYTPTSTGDRGPTPPLNSLQELVGLINDRVLSVSNRLGCVADKL